MSLKVWFLETRSQFLILSVVPAMANNVQVVLLTQLLLGGGYILAGVFGQAAD